jgi:dTDP-4-amino-4,6-dideoxygalactose transaminase
LIPFNKPPFTGNEEQYVLHAMQSDKISGDGYYGRKCQAWFEERLNCKKTLLTPSCTAALEMAAILIDIQPNDEVIMPSYTFVSSANAFVLRGAKIVFVDIRPDTMNMDETLIEAAITPKTKAIVPVHYAGVSCEMDVIMDIAERRNLFVIEDAAQGVMSTYKGKALGAIGHLGTYSFHETKNYTSGGEGGLLLINDSRFIERAEIIREKGTNRSSFFRGQVDKYTWIDLGSSYLPSELQAAFLWGQLEKINEINNNRLETWKTYSDSFIELEKAGQLYLPCIPEKCKHNAHMIYLKLHSLEQRTALIEHLKAQKVAAVFHYIPLHTAPAGLSFGRFNGDDKFTTIESEKLIRLPMYYNMSNKDIMQVVCSVNKFYK